MQYHLQTHCTCQWHTHGARVGLVLDAPPMPHCRVVRERLVRLRQVDPPPEAPAKPKHKAPLNVA